MGHQIEKIDPYEDNQTYNDDIYQTNPFPSDGPVTTYENLPQGADIKFLTPVKIAILDDFKDEEEIRKELELREMELNNRLLFTDVPKKINMIKQNEFLPYYDPTYQDKSIKINRLKNRINQLRHYLNIPEFEGNLYVEVRNATFPKGPLDVIKHLNESYYFVDTIKEKYSNITNGNNKKVQDIYDERHSHMVNNVKAHDEDNMIKTIK